MKKFSKEQIMFFITSIIVVLLLIYKTVGFGLITGFGAQNIKYQSSIDSIITLESNIERVRNSVLNNKRDVFNFKITRKAVVPKPVAIVTDVPKVVSKVYKTRLTIEPVTGLELIVTSGDKAKINVNGSVKTIGVGDQVSCARGIEVEIDPETGEETGRTKDLGLKIGVVSSIDKRNVYFVFSGSSKGIKLNAREGAKLLDTDFIPRDDKGGASDEEAGTTGSDAPKVKRKR